MIKALLSVLAPFKLYAYGAILIGLAISGWKLYDTIYERGYAASERIWTAKYADDKTAWEDQRYALLNRARNAEWEAELAQKHIDYAREEERGKHAKTIADLSAKLRAGAIRLYDPYTTTPGDQSNCDRPAEAASNTGGADDQRGTELSTTTAEFLAGEADRADGVVLKYNYCVDTLALFQKSCGMPD